MRADQIVISRPCPVDLDALGVDRSGLDFHCPHCDKSVHLLSNRTEAEAKALLVAVRDQQPCLSYLRTRTGEVVFREPAPIPAERLRARRRVAAGFALALAACAPAGPAQPLAEAHVEVASPSAPAAAPMPSPAPVTPPIADPTPVTAAIPACPPATTVEATATTSAPRKPRPAARKTKPVRRGDLDVIDGGAF